MASYTYDYSEDGYIPKDCSIQKLSILNPYCVFDGEEYPELFNGIIQGYSGSTAEKYAKEYGYNFESIGDMPVFEQGDLNADNSVSIVDAILLQKWLLVTPDAVLPAWEYADMNSDRVVDVFDLALLKRKLLSQ